MGNSGTMGVSVSDSSHRDIPFISDLGAETEESLFSRLYGLLRELTENVSLTEADATLISKTYLKSQDLFEKGNFSGSFLLLQNVWITINAYFLVGEKFFIKHRTRDLVDFLDEKYFGKQNRKTIVNIATRVEKTVLQ